MRESFITKEETMDNMIIISGEKGCKVHHIARVICSLPNVYWYSNIDNGIHPWNISSAKSSKVTARKITPKHFDRVMENGDKLPPFWDYVQGFFPKQEDYLRAIFFPALEKARRQTSKTLVFTTHLPPFNLRQYFGTIPTINVLYDAKRALKRRLLTSSNFPGYVRQKDFVPEDNPYLVYLESLKKQKKDFTQKDLWAQKTHMTFWKNEYSKEYEDYLSFYMNKNLETRKMKFANVHNVNMDKVDWKSTKKFLRTYMTVPQDAVDELNIMSL